jgi:hypothetical protein
MSAASSPPRARRLLFSRNDAMFAARSASKCGSYGGPQSVIGNVSAQFSLQPIRGDTMFSPTRTALYLALGAMAFAANEAYAQTQTCKVISGCKICSTWRPGSEICQVTAATVSALGGAPVTVRCSVTGADVVTTEPLLVCDSGALPPGTLICGPAAPVMGNVSLAASTAAAKKGKGKKKDACDDDNDADDEGCFISNPDYIPPTPPGGPVFFADATNVKCKGDKCTASAEVLPPGDICPAGTPELINFTAEQFLATTHVCGAGGGEGGTCVDLYQLCTKHGTTYDCVNLDNNPFDPFCGSAPG